MRPGQTKTTSFSLDSRTLKNLKALAAPWRNEDGSDRLADVAIQESTLAAAEAYFDKYGVPPLTERAL